VKPVCVVAAGAVSALGIGVWQHALLSRAEIGPDAGGAFLDDEGETISCGYCGWLAPSLEIGTRVGHLAAAALAGARHALGAFGSSPTLSSTAVDLVLAAEAPEWSDEHRAQAAEIASRGFPTPRVSDGASAFFEAIANASESLSNGQREAAIIVAADSWVSKKRLQAYRKEIFDPWGPSLPRAAEGAAAVVLMSPEAAARHELTPLAQIELAGCGFEASHDDNDEPIDGDSLSALLHQAGTQLGSRRIRASFGPFDVGSLRRDTWNIAAARNAWCFDPDPDEVAIEQHVGHVGAASAALNFVLGLGACLHRALPNVDRQLTEVSVFCSWALSRSGERGLALASTAKQSSTERRVATVGAVRSVPVRRPDEHWLPDVPPAESEQSPDATGADVAEPPAGAATAVTLDPERIAPKSHAEREASIQVDLLDRISALLRMRATDGQHELPRQEARLLAQIDAMPAAGVTPDMLLAHGEAALEDEDPWMAAAAMHGLCAIDPEGGALGRLVATLTSASEVTESALAALASPGSVQCEELCRETLGEPGPTAFGLELLSLHGAASAPMFADRLDHEDPGVVRSALRAWSRLSRSEEGPFGEHTSSIVECLGHDDPVVRFEAARTLLLFGVDEPLRRLREGDPLLQSMGVGTLELCVLGGQLSDMPHVERAITGLDVGPELLDAIARFGHPGSWAFLLNHLEGSEQQDDAAAALRTLFGELTADPSERRSAIWRDVLGARDFDQSVRLRRGQPWARDVLVEECKDPNASRVDIAHRCDELAYGSKAGGSYASILYRWGMSVDEVLRAT